MIVFPSCLAHFAVATNEVQSQQQQKTNPWHSSPCRSTTRARRLYRDWTPIWSRTGKKDLVLEENQTLPQFTSLMTMGQCFGTARSDLARHLCHRSGSSIPSSSILISRTVFRAHSERLIVTCGANTIDCTCVDATTAFTTAQSSTTRTARGYLPKHTNLVSGRKTRPRALEYDLWHFCCVVFSATSLSLRHTRPLRLHFPPQESDHRILSPVLQRWATVQHLVTLFGDGWPARP